MFSPNLAIFEFGTWSKNIIFNTYLNRKVHVMMCALKLNILFQMIVSNSSYCASILMTRTVYRVHARGSSWSNISFHIIFSPCYLTRTECPAVARDSSTAWYTQFLIENIFFLLHINMIWLKL